MHDDKPVLTRTAICAGLRDLGLRSGDLVIVHSSLKSFGRVEGGADAVIDALLDAVSPGGTVAVPTLTYGPFAPENPPPLFDPKTRPCIVGHIPETFRQRPEAKRSLHPTHSIAAIGPLADELIRDHERARSPIGPDGAWGRIAQHGGYVLMLGAPIHTCTMKHGPEEMLIPWRLTDWVDCQVVAPEGVRTVRIRLHQRPPEGKPQWSLERVLDQMERTGGVRRGAIGPSPQVLIHAARFWVAVLADIERSVLATL
ncbi:MAG: hypothetical protein A3K19_07750 [Lentisphaerae bacterium RIFOXYB12_FULL_65_16]|nr:MAG: hypothetical protein A3K18_07395 [Lentisphaerae bacterium RIFOXYA12_64_32]OGV87541.1 MAG: hypothetical protein A3K19_07750 [Lentisphaerae bacterium RIFOXYB12_FULL_65_16]